MKKSKAMPLVFLAAGTLVLALLLQMAGPANRELTVTEWDGEGVRGLPLAASS